MGFQKLSDNEIEEYLNSIYAGDKEYTDYSQKKDFIKQYSLSIDGIKDSLNRMIVDLDKTKSLLAQKEYQEVYEKCLRMGVSIERLGTKLKTMPSNYGDSENVKKIREMEEGILSFNYSSGFMRVILPNLLPKRIKYDSASRKVTHWANYDALRSGFHRSFQKEFETGRMPAYDGRVVLHIVNYFKSEDDVMDADNLNLDPKIIIDTICTFMLIDDSMLYCSQFMEYGIADHPHTEITIIPEEEWIQYLKSSTERNIVADQSVSGCS